MLRLLFIPETYFEVLRNATLMKYQSFHHKNYVTIDYSCKIQTLTTSEIEMITY